MTSIKNLSCLGSLASDMGSVAFHTLREGSTIERIVVGTTLFATAAYVAYKIINMASRFFGKSQPRGTLPKYELSQQAKEDLKKRLELKYPSPSSVNTAPKNVASNNPVPQLPSHSLLDFLTINGTVMPQEDEIQLARALHAYQAFKIKIGGDDDRFIFLATTYLQNKADGLDGLPPVVRWQAKGLRLKIPSHSNETFADLESQLNKVRLSLKNLIPALEPFAVARFKDETSKEIHDLADLYQIVKLQGPHILSSVEVELKKGEVEAAKIQLHESRLNIIDKTLSTLRAVLINDFVKSFGEQHNELYTIFGSNPEALHFVLENICWHALDRVFETVETTFIPSKETEQKTRKIDLDDQLVKVLKEEGKLKAAQGYLLQILESPDNNVAMGALVELLLGEKGNSPERESLIKKLQTPELQSKEESVEKELGRLQGMLQLYDKLEVTANVADAGKKALLRGNVGLQDTCIVEEDSSTKIHREFVVNDRNTYAGQIDELSSEIVKAGSASIKEVASHKWQESLVSLDEELALIPHLDPQSCDQLVKEGWVKYPKRQALRLISGDHRWLITKKMIVQKLAKDSLQGRGEELLQEVGKRGAYFFKTLYSRLVTALLAFDQRTRAASEEGSKPADRIIDTFFKSVLHCHAALGEVQKIRPYDVGLREDDVVKELEDNEGIHLNAVNKPSADAVFLVKLILQLLSVLQPEGLTGDIHDALNKSLISPGESEPTLIRDAIKKYNESIRPVAEPWIKPVGNILIQLLQNIIEKTSASNIASQLSDLLNPMNLNALLIDFLKEDVSAIVIEEQEPLGDKDRLKWYRDDEAFVTNSLNTRFKLDAKVKEMEKELEELKKMTLSENLKKRPEGLDSLKTELAMLDLQLAPQLLRRLVIANELPSNVAGYVVQFADDVFELMQYPRILRHIVFNVLEKSVHSLAKPLENGAENLLQERVNAVEDKSVFDFLFSDRLKTSIGNDIVGLFSSMSATDNQWSTLMWIGQTVAKKVLSGHFVFTQIQKQIEKLIELNYNSPEAVNWSAAKLVVTMNKSIVAFAKDETDEGMKAVIASQLRKAVGLKEEIKVDEKNGNPKIEEKSALSGIENDRSEKTHNISKKSGNGSKTNSKLQSNLNVVSEGVGEGFVIL